MSADPVVAMALRAGAALLFAAAAAHKLRDLPAFRAALAGYRLLPATALAPAAWAFVGVELAVAVGCLVPALAPRACVAAAGLLALYALAIAVNLARGRRGIDCGCGGPGGRRPLGIGLVLRNLALAALLLGAALPSGPRPLVWLDAVTATTLLGAIALLYAASDVALANAARLRDGEAAP